MSANSYITARITTGTRLWFALWTGLFVTLLVLVVIKLVALRDARKPVEETVTVESSRAVQRQTVDPVVISRRLPQGDPDIELAEDRVAEAVTYLNQAQKAAALRALTQAQAAANRALERQQEVPVKEKLLATRKQIEQMKQIIENGQTRDGTREVKDVNQKGESLSY